MISGRWFVAAISGGNTRTSPISNKNSQSWAQRRASWYGRGRTWATDDRQARCSGTLGDETDEWRLQLLVVVTLVLRSPKTTQRKSMTTSMAFWTCWSSRRPSIQFDLAMDLILRFADWKSSAPPLLRRCHRLHEKAALQTEKRKVRKSSSTANKKPLRPNSWSQTVHTTRLAQDRLTDRSVKSSHNSCSQSPWHHQFHRTET